MATWRYIKGSEKDFEGFAEWVTGVLKHNVLGSLVGTGFPDDWKEWHQYTLIAQRERVTSVNDDRLAQDMERIKQSSVLVGKPDNTDTLITERGTRYGKFKDGAEIMRDLKHVMHEVDGWNNLTPSQKEALDMIQHKIGRILNGDPTYDDNWKDIAGYATLIVEELNGVKK